MTYALIKNGVVVNIIRFFGDPNEIPKEYLPITVEGMTVQIGDTYTDGVFYRDGELILTDLELMAIRAQEGMLSEMDEAYREGVNSI